MISPITYDGPGKSKTEVHQMFEESQKNESVAPLEDVHEWTTAEQVIN